MTQDRDEPGFARCWRFGDVEFDERSHALRREGCRVDIEPTPLKVMLHLLACAGDLVSKDDLLQAVWPGRIISDAALAKSIARLRVAIGDHDQSLIKTHHRFGYRLTARVSVERVRRHRPAASDCNWPPLSARSEFGAESRTAVC